MHGYSACGLSGLVWCFAIDGSYNSPTCRLSGFIVVLERH